MVIQAAGYLSGIVIIISLLPYFKDIFLKKTKPERASWFIWSVLGLISFFSQFAKGASYSLVMTGVQALGDLSIFLLAVKYGIGGFARRDFIALIGAGIGLFLWYLTKEAAIALFIVIFIDAIGVVLTVIKTYKNPGTETTIYWVMTSISGLLACIAVGKINFILLAYPLYILLASLAVLVSIKLGFRHSNTKTSFAAPPR